MSALPTITYTISLDEGLIPDLRLEAVQGSDFELAAVLTREGEAIDHEGLQLRFNASTPDRETWVRSVTGTAGGIAAESVSVAVPAADMDNSGRMLFDLVVLSGGLVVIHARGELVLYPTVPASGTLPAGNVVDFGRFLGYSNVEEGPVLPDGVTTEWKEPDTAKGQKKLGVKDDVFLGINAQAADADPAGPSLAAAFAGKAAARTYKGYWNPVTNSPALADGTGTLGDYYRVHGLTNVETVVDLGTGDRTVLGRQTVIYDGAVWQPLLNLNSVGPQRSLLDINDFFGQNGATIDATWTSATPPSLWPRGGHLAVNAGTSLGFPANIGNVFTMGSSSFIAQFFTESAPDTAAASFWYRQRHTSLNEWTPWRRIPNGAGITGAGVAALNSALNWETKTPADFRALVGAIPDAPIDTKQYGRKDGAWTEITPSAAPITAQTISTNTTLSPTVSGTVYDLTLTASPILTIADFPSATQAAEIEIVLRQDSTGGRVPTIAGNVEKPGGVTPTFSASANAKDTMRLRWIGATWLITGRTFDQG